MSTAQPQVTTCDDGCGASPVAEEGRSPGVIDSVLAVAYVLFFLAVAVAGSLWIMADLSATLIHS